MDPQQRILLQVAYQALEDSGYIPNSTRSFNTETLGCFIGAATLDYVQNLRNDIDVYYSTGFLIFIIMSGLDLRSSKGH
jgi:acyl transferase domain-containing protein